jgi:hypothetical protein
LYEGVAHTFVRVAAVGRVAPPGGCDRRDVCALSIADTYVQWIGRSGRVMFAP